MIKGGLDRLASRQAPTAVAPNGQSLRNVSGETDVPAHLREDGDDRAWFRLGSIMTAILVSGVVWITIVAWLVSQLPEK
ncbi:MAG: hypothetical protein ABI882_09715 [Acidobacteriota bacterium]